jgi:hypothetical protein
MIEFNPNTLKNSLEEKFGAKIVIKSSGESKKDLKDKNDFIQFVSNLDTVLVGQELLGQNFGIDLTEFMQPIYDANIYLMDKLYTETGREAILMFIELSDQLSEATPLIVSIFDKNYSIVDMDELYYTIKLIQNLNKSKTK